jgi:hypothetical protein
MNPALEFQQRAVVSYVPKVSKERNASIFSVEVGKSFCFMRKWSLGPTVKGKVLSREMRISGQSLCIVIKLPLSTHFCTEDGERKCLRITGNKVNLQGKITPKHKQY